MLDWWRVEALDPGHLLRLRAEMKVPGRAWLELSIEQAGGGHEYHQRAIFLPHGLPGRLYWLAVLPFHGVIFKGMAVRITAPVRSARRTGPTRRRPTARSRMGPARQRTRRQHE